MNAEPGFSSRHAKIEASKVRELMSVRMEAFSASRLSTLQWGAR